MQGSARRSARPDRRRSRRRRDRPHRVVTKSSSPARWRSRRTTDDDARRDTPTAACRLALYALVRLKAYAAAGRRRARQSAASRSVRWWPVAFALQRLEDKRALPALLTLAKESNPYTRAFAVKGLAALEGSLGRCPCCCRCMSSGDRGVLVETVRALGAHRRPGRRPAAARSHAATRADRSASPRGGDGASAACISRSVGDALLDVLADPESAIRAAALRSLAAVRSRRLRDGAVGPRSRSALERARRARDGARHAAAGERPAAAERDARPTPISG